uniref:hypothetical protein n=1 Tax=uncultured Erythrobacter sp. TaxID=263913 RepID=UPI00260734CE|nr:hypothetical protein [uncultured Erythrobacter sp.]
MDVKDLAAAFPPNGTVARHEIKLMEFPMFRIRAKTVSFCQRLAAIKRGSGNDTVSIFTDQATIARAIHLRANTGQSTSLRQLNKITDISQSRALKALNELERMEMVTIDQNIHDEFESTITLNDEIRSNLDKAGARDAA